jgi:hypothetical protein
MKNFSDKLTLAGAAIGISAVSLMFSSPANAATFTPLPLFTDSDFNALISDGIFAEDVIAESRGGNGGPGGPTEFNIQDVIPPGPGGPPNPQSNFTWPNGQEVDFSLTYDGSTIEYTVGGISISKADVNDLTNFNTIYLRTRSNSDGSVMEIRNLVVDGMTYNGTVTSNDSDTIDYLKISDIGNNLSITGQSFMSWTTPSIPQQSRLAYQIKIGLEKEEVPEPTMTLGLLALGGVGLLSSRKKVK